MATGRMPAGVRAEVSWTILERAVAVHWEDLTFKERSSTYSEWVADPLIGGLIGKYLPADRIRVWIKDGPIKEYQRAKRGLGPYAKYVPTAKAMEAKITALILGNEWTVCKETIDVKPSRFTAINSKGEETLIIWGNLSDLKHIVWAGLTAPAHDDLRLVVVTTPSQPLTSDAKAIIRTVEFKLRKTIRVIDR